MFNFLFLFGPTSLCAINTTEGKVRLLIIYLCVSKFLSSFFLYFICLFIYLFICEVERFEDSAMFS